MYKRQTNGDLLLQAPAGNWFYVKTDAGNDNSIIAKNNGAIELYHNNVKKFETAAQTQIMYGNLELTDGWSLYLDNGFNNATSQVQNVGADGSSDLRFKTTPNGGSLTTALTLDSSQNATFAGTVTDSIGNLRSIPLQDESSAPYTLVASDAGQCVHAHSSTTTVTVDPSVFSAGQAVSIVNGSGGDITIAQGTSMTLRNSADASTGDRTLSSFGMCTIWFSGASTAYISGAGLS